jgi:hypothetical protein
MYQVRERAADDLHQREHLAEPARIQVAARVLGGEQDRLGDHGRLVDRRDGRGLDTHLGAGVVEEGCVDRGGQDQGDVDAALFPSQLHAQRLGEAFHAVLSGAVGRLERDGALRQHRGDVDDRTLVLAPQVRQ